MPREIRNKHMLYHLTSLENITGILLKGLCPRNILRSFEDVADPEIIDFRGRNGLNDYVPFHFFSKNPFDGRVQKDYPDTNFIYVCVYRTFAQRNNFRIIPTHPIAMGDNLFLYDYNEGMEQIDWDTMEETNYQDTYCRQVCMAESLSDCIIYPNDFCAIYVKDEATSEFVKRLTLGKLGRIPFNIRVNTSMFVSGV
ncbi:DarT ssDNA thymidine ADP-ribosyltransferase family protein [Domibacillus tundrae]|uniref:DarT ssDNA thymidine ADP-ribosyltransferase family protein n=1 Tax=Domibacillus tundrae TaxID=1587527 RepID=UPI000617B3AE|nr:DarT ssDNA thymidine ADP-ribosyltransferase family protein [Domibacillus tundrae]